MFKIPPISELSKDTLTVTGGSVLKPAMAEEDGAAMDVDPVEEQVEQPNGTGKLNDAAVAAATALSIILDAKFADEIEPWKTISYLPNEMCNKWFDVGSFNEDSPNICKWFPCEHSVCLRCNKSSTECPVCKTSIAKERIMTLARFVYKHYQPSDFQLVVRRAQCESKTNCKGQSPLHIASIVGDTAKACILVCSGIDFNAKDAVGWTPLHDAVANNNMDIAQLLIESGALLDVPAFGTYETPLHLSRDPKMSQMLCNYGANPYALNSRLMPAWASYRGIYDGPSIKRVAFTVYQPTLVLRDVSKATEKLVMDNPTKFLYNKKWRKLSHQTTHMVIGKALPYAKEVVQALAQGIFLVTEKWVEDYIKTDGDLNIMDYTIDVEGVSFARSHNILFLGLPRLFDQMNFYILPGPPHLIDMHYYKATDLKMLIAAAGGNVLKRAPALRTVDTSLSPYHADRSSSLILCRYFVVYDAQSPPDLRYRMKELRHVPSEWVMKCLTEQAVLDFQLV